MLMPQVSKQSDGATHTLKSVCSKHIDPATSNSTLKIAAPTGSVVMIQRECVVYWYSMQVTSTPHASWGWVNGSQWTTFERIQDTNGTEAAAGADTMSTDLHGNPVFTKVRVTEVMFVTFSKAADKRREQMPASIASTGPNW